MSNIKQSNEKGIIQLLEDLSRTELPSRPSKRECPALQFKDHNTIQPLGKQIKRDDPRWDKACEVNWLMTQAGTKHAIKLQLENLVLTYGYGAVNEIFENLELTVIKGGLK